MMSAEATRSDIPAGRRNQHGGGHQQRTVRVGPLRSQQVADAITLRVYFADAITDCFHDTNGVRAEAARQSRWIQARCLRTHQ